MKLNLITCRFFQLIQKRFNFVFIAIVNKLFFLSNVCDGIDGSYFSTMQLLITELINALVCPAFKFFKIDISKLKSELILFARCTLPITFLLQLFSTADAKHWILLIVLKILMFRNVFGLNSTVNLTL